MNSTQLKPKQAPTPEFAQGDIVKYEIKPNIFWVGRVTDQKSSRYQVVFMEYHRRLIPVSEETGEMVSVRITLVI